MTHMELTRRSFVVTAAAAGGGLILGVSSAAMGAAVNARPWLSPNDKDGTEISRWLSIDPDGVVTIRIAAVEMGQDALTTGTMILNEELQADWSHFRAEYADANRHVNNDNLYGSEWYSMFTVASQHTRSNRTTYQQAGASARERLKEAAAQAWGVSRSQVVAKNGVLSSGNNSGSYGQFATQAASIQFSEEPAIKAPDQFTLIGTSVARLDTPLKVNGGAQFGIDTRLPGMVYAAVQANPVPWGGPATFDFSAIKDRPGIITAIELRAVEERRGTSDLQNAVAVVADSWYRAKTALELMPIEWETGPESNVSTEGLFAARRALLDEPGVAQEYNTGDAVGILGRSGHVVTAEYERPHDPHARMEPQNATVSIAGNRVDVYVGTQNPPSVLTRIAEQLGVDTANVFVHNAFLGGGFGGSTGTYASTQAAEIARQLGRPVKLVWTREEDFRHDKVRPMSVIRFSASLGSNGMPEAIVTRNVTSGFYASSNLDWPHYSIPNQHHEYHNAPSHLPTGAVRGVWYGLNGLARESFMDEMALAGGHDPLDFRIAMASETPDWVPVLTALKEKSGFTTDLPRGEGMGVAIVEKTNATTITAICATVTVSRRGQLRTERVVVVYDSGHVVQPVNCVAQVESCIAYELTHVLTGGLVVRHGQHISNNFDTYKLMQIGGMPEVEVHAHLSGGERWGGMGEPATASITPAVANAIYFATGKRIRSTPFVAHDLSWS